MIMLYLISQVNQANIALSMIVYYILLIVLSNFQISNNYYCYLKTLSNYSWMSN